MVPIVPDRGCDMSEMKIYFDRPILLEAKASLPQPAAWDEAVATAALEALIVLANGGTVEGLDFTAEGKTVEEH